MIIWTFYFIIVKNETEADVISVDIALVCN